MGFFDQLMNEVSGAAGPADPAPAGQPPAAQASVMQGLLGMLGSGHAGGLAGMLQAFEQGGLGQAAASWVGNGQNVPVTAEQVQSVLGSEKIQELAQRAGIPPEAASQAIAAVLPGLIDKLTPNGQLDHGLLAEGLAMLGCKP